MIATSADSPLSPSLCLLDAVVRGQEFLLAGDMDGSVTIWEVTFDGLTHTATLAASLSHDKRDDEISSLLCNSGMYLAPHGHEFFVVGYSSGHISVRPASALSCE